MKPYEYTGAEKVAVDELDKLRRTMNNATEEYGIALDEYERDYGLSAREFYEEQYV